MIICQKVEDSKTLKSSSNIMSLKMTSLYLSCFISFLVFFRGLMNIGFHVSGFLRNSLLFLFIGHSKCAQEQTCHIKGKPETDDNKKYHVDLSRSIKDLWSGGTQKDKRIIIYLSIFPSFKMKN